MKTVWTAVLMLEFATIPVWAAPAAGVVTAVDTPGVIWVGQKITLSVQLSVPGYFASAPTFDLPKVRGVLIFPPAGSPTVGNETRGDVSCTTQRHELTVISSKAGEVVVPPFVIRFASKAEALDQTSAPQSVTTRAISFSVKQPPGSASGQAVITSADLQITEIWKPEPHDAKPGEAFVRTIRWNSGDLPGMAFPPFSPEHPDGLGIYQADPAVDDRNERGSFRGGRVDTITYVCKSGGNFTIPAWSVRWWDPAAGEMKSAEFPARRFRVTAPPVPPESMTGRWRDFYQLHRRDIFIGLPPVLAAGVFMRKTLPFWKALYQKFFPRRLGPLNPP